MVSLWMVLACAPEVAEPRGLDAERLARVDTDFIAHIVTVPLNGESLLSDPVIGADAATSSAHWLYELLAYCALPYGEELVIDTGTSSASFPGWLGAWPDWAVSPCGEDCQESVTGCILAKTNVYGITVEILSLGELYPKGGEAHYEAYPIQEGAFFGNWFTFPQKLYSCVGEGVDPFHRAFRTCTHEGNGCHIQHVGACSGFDGYRGQATEGQVCGGFDETYGYYTDCYDRPSDAEGVFPADARRYRYATTINIQDSHLGTAKAEALEGSCFAP